LGSSLVFLILIVFPVAGLLARRNLRLGRSDRRGAFRLGVAIFFLQLSVRLLSAHHAPELASEARLLLVSLNFGLSAGVLLWLLYVAVEPHVRRAWPQMLIGWNRLLIGQFRDPLVGREVLIGVAVLLVVGAAMNLGGAIGTAWSGFPPPMPRVFASALSLDLRHGLSFLADSLGGAILGGLVLVVLTFLLLVLFRARAAAIVAAGVVLTASLRYAYFGGASDAVGFMLAALVVIPLVALLVRVGLVSYIAAAFATGIAQVVPLTLDPAAPYAVWSYLILGAIVLLSAYGFFTALAGRPIFSAGLLKDELAR